MSERADWREEMQAIAKRGRLNARDVVKFARDPGTSLHAMFVWDNDRAGDRYRLHQARNLIRVYAVRELNTDEPSLDRVFVSLRGDRQHGRGYRSLANVLSDDGLRGQLFDDALDDMRYFRAKYRRLQELADVFAAMDRVEASRAPRRKAG